MQNIQNHFFLKFKFVFKNEIAFLQMNSAQLGRSAILSFDSEIHPGNLCPICTYKLFSMWKDNLLNSILLFQLFLECWNFTQYVDLAQPITLRKDAFNITAMSFIQDGPSSYHYYVAFSDGAFRAYLQDYSSYYNFTSYSGISKVVGFPFSYAHSLSNGSIYYYQTYIITTLSSDSLQLANYVYGKNTPIRSLLMSENILAFKTTGLPTNSSIIIAPFNVIVCSGSIYVQYYNQPLITIYTFSASQSGPSAIGAVHYKTSISSTGNLLTFQQTFAITISDSILQRFVISIDFQYSNSNYVFLSANSSYTTQASGLSFIPDAIIVFDSYILLKMKGTNHSLAYDMEDHQFIELCPDNPVGQIFSVISYNGFMYLMQQNGIIETYFETSIHLGFSSTVLNLPNNNYRFVRGKTFNILYVVGTPDVYKTGLCINMSIMVNGACVDYSCNDLNCRSCKLTEQFCTRCSTGWVSNDDRKCQVDFNYMNSSMINSTHLDPTHTANASTTNSTANSTNITNIIIDDPTIADPTSVNGTNKANITNTTASNSTQNNSSDWNSTNSTSSNSSTTSSSQNSTNSTSNTTKSNQTSISLNTTSNTSISSGISLGNVSQLSQVFPILNSELALSLYSFLMNTTKTAISIPGGRKIISPIFYYFGNYDDLSLYQRHFREYGSTMQYLFDQINRIQKAKWSLINYGIVFNVIFKQSGSFEQVLSYQDEYLEITEGEGSEGIMGNAINFFFTSTPIIIIAFIFFRIVFRVLFNFKISKILRKFDLWGYFLIIIFEGNIQQFAFSLMAELRHCFTLSPTTKMLKLFLIMFGFAVTLLSFGGYLIGKIGYKKLNSYLLQNQFNSLRGNTAILLQNGIRNFILGCIHYWLRFYYSYQASIVSLLTVELSFNIFFIYSVSDRIYKGKWSVWLYIQLNFIRFLLILTLVKDYRQINEFYIEIIQAALILLMILLFILCIFIGLIDLLREMKEKCNEKFSKALQIEDKKVSFANHKLKHCHTFNNLNRRKGKAGCQINRTFTKDRRIYTIVDIQ